MKGRAKAGPFANGGRNRRRSGGERIPLGIAQAILGADAPRARSAIRHARVVIGDDEHRRVGRGRSAREQMCDPQRAFEPFVDGDGAGQCDRHEGADEAEPAPSDLVRQSARLGGQKSPIAQFRAGVAGGSHFIEHLRRRRSGRGGLEFKQAPRAWGIGDADHRKSRPLRRAVSYDARAACTSRRVDTSATGTSHHES